MSHLARESADKRANEIEAGWRRLRYVDAREPRFVDLFLERVNWHSLGLQEVDLSALRHRIRELLEYFQNPSFDSYYRLRTEGTLYSFKLNPVAQSMLKSADPPVAAELQKGPREAVHLVWEAMHTHGSNFVVPRIGAACLDEIAIAACSADSAVGLLNGEVGKGITKAGQARAGSSK